MMTNLWKRWQSIARRIGDFQARIILTSLYFTVIAPFALIIKFAADPLSLKKRDNATWQLKPGPEGSPQKRATNQF